MVPNLSFGPKAMTLLPKLMKPGQNTALDKAMESLMEDPYREYSRTVAMRYRACTFYGVPSLYTVIPIHGETVEVVYRVENDVLVIALIKYLQ